MNGKLIVIEGVDGTGKNTQAQLLIQNLKKKSISAHLIGFPDYNGSRIGKTIGEMLAGKFGNISNVHPYFTASLFALDRAEKRSEILDKLEQGEWVICDRYVYSNVAHQACRIQPQERKDFLSWIEYIEFDILELPKADTTILLSMDDRHSKVLREQRKEHSYSGSILDLHEMDLESMSNARQIYEELGRNLGWTIIDCTRNGSLRTIEEISHDIFYTLKSNLPNS